MPNSFRERAYTYDWLILGFSSFMVVLILVFGRPFGEQQQPLLFYVSSMILSILIVRFVDERRSRWFAALRILYPVALFPFYYRMMGSMVFLFFDSFLDWHLTALEKSLFGMNPTLFIDRHWLSVGWNEVFSFFYFTYYLMMPGFFIPLFFRKKDRIIKETLSAICLTFFVSYVVFMAYPIEGPRWFFAQNYQHPVNGILFRPLVEFIIRNGAFHGGAMPSTHVAVAMVMMFACFRYFRHIGWLLLPVNIGLAAGTVWGRFHYASDVIVGAVIMLVCTLLVWKQFDHWSPREYNMKQEEETVKNDVS